MEGELVDDFIMQLSTMMDEELLTNVHLVYQDNTLTIAVKNGNGKKRPKYMKVCQKYVKERLAARRLEIEYMKTFAMLGDVLTKPIRREQFHKLVNLILGYITHLSNSHVIVRTW